MKAMPIVLEARPGFTLTNGENYGKKVYLGANDAPENWREIPDAEAPGAMEWEE